MRYLYGALTFLVLAAVLLFFLGWRVTAPRIVRPPAPPDPSFSSTAPPRPAVTVTVTAGPATSPGR